MMMSRMEKGLADMGVPINQFNQWTTQELKEWCEVYSSTKFLQTINNINTYLEALNELNNRKDDIVDN